MLRLQKLMITGFICLIPLCSLKSQVNWQRYPGNPVVPAWSGNSSDPNPFYYTYAPSVLIDSATGLYRIWFASFLHGESAWSISYATSSNGIDWTFYSQNPVLRVGPPGSFDSHLIADPYVIYDGTEYKMYYNGNDGQRFQTGLPRSSDGIHWTKFSGNPIIAVVPNSWESNTASSPKVFFDGTHYTIMYIGSTDGSHYDIGQATSENGINFVKNPSNPVLHRGAPGSWDANSVTIEALGSANNKLFVFFCGGAYTPIGFATSSDRGTTWTKYPNNPVFALGIPGSWDDHNFAHGSLVITENTFRYWYTGLSASRNIWQIGYAEGSLAPPIIESDTAALWHFDETAGSIAYDASPNQNNGNAIGTTIVGGVSGNARQFNGSGNYINVGDPGNGSLDFGLDQSFTIEAWFKTTSSNLQVMIRKGLAPAPGYCIQTEDGYLYGLIGNRGDSHYPDTLLIIRSNQRYNDGAWHHVALVRDRAIRKLGLFVDGQLSATPIDDCIEFPLASDRPLTIGRWETIPLYFAGSIDEVQISGFARYQIPTANSDTAGYWHFDETMGSIAYDASPNHNDGHATGTTIIPGEFGNARQFNGQGDYVFVGDPANASLDFADGQSFTIEAWFRTTMQGDGTILRKGLAPLPGYDIMILDGHVRAEVGNRGDGSPPDTLLRIVSNNTYNDGGWHKITYVRDRSQHSDYLYVDNILAATPVEDQIPFSLANDRPFTIGRWETVPTYFAGSIDEIRISRGAKYPEGSLAPDVHVSPMEIDFGIVPVGANSFRQLQISNVGLQDTLTVSGIESNNSVFTTNETSFSLAPNTSRTVTVEYAPTIAQVDTASLAIASNDPDNPVVYVPLRGRGFALGTSPLIGSIQDIPEDQGKQVRVRWYRSIYDTASSSTQITSYDLWRRVPGNTDLWDFIVTVPAVQFSEYSYVAPTLHDSTGLTGIRWSVFRVSARTGDGQFFFSGPDSGYSVDNLPPHPPANLAASLGVGVVNLTWDIPPDPDIMEYGVYRSNVSNFVPSEGNRIGSPHTNLFNDQNISGSTHWYYRVAAFDTAGNQSNYSNQLVVVITDVPNGQTLPTVFSLRQNYPNPFNPTSVITYDVPQTSHVTIKIYDTLGREVASLVDGLVQTGTHDVSWNAQNVSSGLYLCRMQAGDFVETMKMVLMK